MSLTSTKADAIAKALDAFQIELPSWGFANTGTRFGKFIQPAAASTIEEKFSDAGEVHRVTGSCPSVALHVLWDLPEGINGVRNVNDLAKRYGVRAGAINPNVFQDQHYKFGSLGNPDPAIREIAMNHLLESADIAAKLGSRDISLWFADGSNYPGTANIRHRRKWFEEGLAKLHGRLTGDQRMLVEYKPFEPAFYHTDIGDWGMALLLARAAGPRAKVLVDTGHHYQGQNIEQIVTWLLTDNMLAGFHFNDRRYADDDLTLGSIDPYQIFRIFHEISFFEWETKKARRHRVHDRSEPQLERQNRSDDSDRDDRAGIICECRDCGSCASRGFPNQMCSRRRRILFEGCVFHRCAASNPRMGEIARPAGRSDGCVPPEWLSGMHYEGAQQEKRGVCFKLRVTIRSIFRKFTTPARRTLTLARLSKESFRQPAIHDDRLSCNFRGAFRYQEGYRFDLILRGDGALRQRTLRVKICQLPPQSFHCLHLPQIESHISLAMPSRDRAETSSNLQSPWLAR